MRTFGKFVLGVIGVATLFVALAEPAEARRRFRFGTGSFGGSSYSEKIDKVYDLPDNDTYLNGGQYYDLGAFYRLRNGAEVRPAAPVFVLYNGDRYLRLDDAKLALIKEDLGMDPTAAYRARYAANLPTRPRSSNEIERREGETPEQFRARMRGVAPPEHRENAASDSSPATQFVMGWLVAMLVPMVAILWFSFARLRKFLRRRAASAIMPIDETMPELNTTSFDQRIAARLRELDGGPGNAMVPAAARTFGRKLA
jgi:hypothetical protein